MQTTSMMEFLFKTVKFEDNTNYFMMYTKNIDKADKAF